MKHGEAAGTGGNETMKGVGIACGTMDVYASDFGHMAHEAQTQCQIITSHRPTSEHR